MEDKEKKVVDLYAYNGVGIIVPRKTGVFWSNQVGGTACVHPEVEGIYIPLGEWLLDKKNT